MNYGEDSIKKVLGISTAISVEMKKAIREWYKAYANKSDWLNKNVESLNVPASVASEIARLVTIENKIEITGSKRADYINEQLKLFKNQKKNIVEIACSVGGCILKPYVYGDKILIDYIYQDEFIPYKYDGAGNISGVIFPSYYIKGDKNYTRLEIHDYDIDKYVIKNRAFVSKDTYVNTNEIRNLGNEVLLSAVPEWADIEEKVIIEGVSRPFYSFFKIPIANNIERKSPLGMSVYARAINDIKKTDIQTSRYDWEFESKETAIDADENLIDEDIYGNKLLPKGKERLYRTYAGGDMSENKLFKIFSPDIRDESFARGIDKYLKRIEFNCGLAYGTLSDPQNVDKTAEEIQSSKQRSYQLVKDIQESLENALRELVEVMDDICTIHGLVDEGTVEQSYVWDDSIIVDAEKEKMQDLQEVRDGLLPEWKYKVKWQGLTEDQAKAEVSGDKGITYEDE